MVEHGDPTRNDADYPLWKQAPEHAGDQTGIPFQDSLRWTQFIHDGYVDEEQLDAIESSEGTSAVRTYKFPPWTDSVEFPARMRGYCGG